MTTRRLWHIDAAGAIERGGRTVLVFVSALIIMGMCWTSVRLAVELVALYGADMENMTKTIIIDVLMVFALLEALRVCLIYYREGRVKVTYVIDAVIVVVLRGLMMELFKDNWITAERLLIVAGLVVTLIAARIITIRFSPAQAGF